MKEVRTLDGYGAVVLGAPLYMFRWHKDAMRFVSRHRQARSWAAGSGFRAGTITHEEAKEFQQPVLSSTKRC